MYHLLFILNLVALTNRELTWKDYTGTPDSLALVKGYAAETSTNWSMEVTTENGRCYFKVTCRFVPEKSWSITQNAQALIHENMHYRISQIFAKRLQLRLDKLQGISESKQHIADKIFDEYWRRSRILQAVFDKETAHSRNTYMELQWEQQIKRQL